MKVVWALFRAHWLSAASYRLNMAFGILGLIVGVVPLFYVARALQPVMQGAIAREGEQYFAFVLVGIIAFQLVMQGMNGLSGAIGTSINSGTLDMMMSVPASPVSVFSGMMSYGFVWTGVRCLIALSIGAVLGAKLVWTAVPAALFVVALTTAAYIGIGLLLSAMTLAFRTTGPIPSAITLATTFLGGVYYPTHVIPSWLEQLSVIVPLTYGLRATRRVLIDGWAFTAVLDDVLMLVAMTAALFLIGIVVMRMAFRYARRAGTLSLY